MRSRKSAGLLLASALLFAPLPAGADDSFEYAVKATYLFRFIPFITWPDGALPQGAAAPLTICEIGEDHFGGKLAQIVADIRLEEHPVTVRRINQPEAGCQIAFIAGGGEAALDAWRGKPVMTVTDSGLKARGVISFVLVENHVRFDIDDALAAADGLTVSSKLLSLAHAVKPRGPAP